MSSLVRRLFASDYAPGTRPTWYFWHDPKTSDRDRRILFKLDCTILVFGCLSYWVKYLDSANLTNAYVTGLREDLNIKSNEYTWMFTYFTIGTALSQIPSNLILTKVPARIWLPGMEFLWGLLTLLLYRSTNAQYIYGLRFMIGFLEGSCFVGMQYILGSWYTKRELGKRTAIFACCAYAGSMFSGFMQVGIQAHMNGRYGLAGWRWLFIIDAILTFVVAGFGFAFFPGTPERPTTWYLSAEDKARCVERLREDGRREEVNLISWNLFKRVFVSWQFALLIPVWICWSNTVGKYSGTVFSLWLKADSPARWTTAQVNYIPTSVSGVNIISMLVTAWAIDLTGRRLTVILCCLTIQIFGTICLLAWNIPMALHFIANITASNDGPTSPIIMTWANILLAGDAQQRALTIAFMNTLGSAVSSIVNQYGYDTRTAPRFQKGIALSLAFVLLEVVGVVYIRYVELKTAGDREAQKHADLTESGEAKSIEDEKTDGEGLSLTPATFRRLLRELNGLQQSPPEGIRLAKEVFGDDGADLSNVKAWVQGPAETPFEGGFFKIRFQFTSEYPAAPPKCTFSTKIFHPNVNPDDGAICVNTLKKDWKPDMGIEHILIVIKCLLIHPNPASALHAEAGHLLLEDFASYAQRAKLMTSIHATPRSPPTEFGDVSSTTEAAPTEGKQALQPSTFSNTESASPADSAAVAGNKRSGSSSTATPSAGEGAEVKGKVVVKKVAAGAKKRGLKRL
ncbi:major facilitator superfamily domain-containing protein [Leucosporidium creatinivorum]|uniref:E2 ubiquitin-conjugating enzyme n=1 Tax=Leucosporidium creatinivorum TaxID=106004 RepID=A0A1Y2EY55_9BASI|nr:major facilitator superfamily domain-containing protein [Leucosporidium creatinivorum]